jgi:hypothetical protein
MTSDRLHVLERKSELVRGGRRVAPRLRAEMDARGLTAKELAMSLSAWAAQDPTNRQPLDYRTIQNAMDGSCALETYFSLSGFLGWDFIEEVQTPVVGADPLTAREIELARHQAQVAAVHARLVRERAARAGQPSSPVLVRGGSVPPLQRRGERRGESPEAPEPA